MGVLVSTRQSSRTSLGSRGRCRAAGFAVVCSQGDRNTATLTSWSNSVNVVTTIVSSGASLEVGVALVRQCTITRDRETICRASTHVTLELGCGRGQDATTTITVSETTFGIDAVGSLSIGKSRGLADSILTIAKLQKVLVQLDSRTMAVQRRVTTHLADDTARATGGSQMEAAGGHKVSKLSVKTTRLTHQVESRAISASAAAMRAAETKIDFMIVILAMR